MIVQLTPEIKEFLERENKRYCKQLGIKPFPILLYSLTDLRKTDSDLTRYNFHKKMGFSVFNSKERHTYINVKSHKVVSDLIDTLAHELLHIKDSNLKHGKELQDKVNKIIIGTWP